MKLSTNLFSFVAMGAVLGVYCAENEVLVKDTSISSLSNKARFLGGALDTTIPSTFERSVTMDGEGCQNVEWTVNKETMKITFRFESSEGADWVGFGLSENGGMKGADLAIVRKKKTEFIVEDRVSIENTLPKLDALQNVELLHAEIHNQRIVAVIRRDLNTCDLDDIPIQPNKQYLVCTSGATDSVGELVYPEPTSAEAKTSKALVNLMLDEDLLLNQMLQPGFLAVDSWESDPFPEGQSVQVTIPGDATQAFLPLQGLQVSAVIPHMHKAGLNARLKLIRDGVHIMDVFKTISFDFDNQVPIYKQWKFLPGDSLLLTCNYKAAPDSVGLFSDEAMCGYTILFVDSEEAPVSINAISPVRYPMEPDREPNSARLGLLYINDNTSVLEFTPKQDRVYFEPIENHRLNLCDLAIRQKVKVPVYSFGEFNITAMVTMMVTFFFCTFVAAEPVWKRINASNSDERLKRNTIVYLGQFIYGTFALGVSVYAGIELYSVGDSLDGVDPSTYVLLRGTIVVQTLTYLVELFYRINVRWEVVLHHVLVAIAVIFNQLASGDTFAAQYILELNLLVFLMAVTDHPLNLTLLLKNMGHARNTWWPKLCKASGVLFVLAKVVPFAFAIALMVQTNNRDDPSIRITTHSFSEWIETEGRISLRDINIFLPILFTGLLVVQIYIGYVLWVLGCRYEKKILSLDSSETDEDEELQAKNENGSEDIVFQQQP